MHEPVTPLLLASVKLSGKYNPPSFADTRINVYAFLIQTTSHTILVDTGVGEGNAYINKQFDPHIYDVGDQLAALGCAIDDVDIVINSHLHFDHCGNNQRFRQAQFYVQNAELQVARSSPYTVREWFDFADADIKPLSGSQPVCTGVEVIATPGHTPGHQAVLVSTPAGKVLIAAQAAFTAAEFLRGGDPDIQAHEGLQAQYRQSIQHLKSLPARATYFSHDAEQA